MEEHGKLVYGNIDFIVSIISLSLLAVRHQDGIYLVHYTVLLRYNNTPSICNLSLYS